jgi:hypothetical protein
MEGYMCGTRNQWKNGVCYRYGIGMLWNPDLNFSIFGFPIITSKKFPFLGNQVAYITVEFLNFCFVCTHYPVKVNNAENKRKKMTNKILKSEAVKKCIRLCKPIYIAGDMNEDPDKEAIGLFKDAGFKLLNDTTLCNPDVEGECEYYKYNTFTYPTKVKPYNTPGYPDLILEYNTRPAHKTLENSIPEFPSEEHKKVSDHYPYVVKVKF